MNNSIKPQSVFEKFGIAPAILVRIVIVACCVAAIRLPGWAIDRRAAEDAALAAQWDVSALPRQLGAWSGEDKEIDERLAKRVGAVSLTDREYKNGMGRKVQVHVASFPSQQISLPHPPTGCYPAAGWKIRRNRWRQVDDDHRYRLLIVAQEDGTAAAVAYWFQLGTFAGVDRDEIRSALQQFRAKGEHAPPMVKVLMHLELENTNVDYTPDLDDLSVRIFEWVKTES
ncbi:MAG: exosortase-associated EpsI family protein [Planctomycetaceae bacterium]|nr:exosortase-associated EpsI family protein [Planctomycetaceae bacterium]